MALLCQAAAVDGCGFAYAVSMARTLDYSILDVFAESPLEGNPLAVFHDARGLSTEQMQAFARETNLSETTFVLPDDPETERQHGVRVRIFTTQEELPFAGHPTLGTASWLWLHHPVLKGAEAITLLLNVGPIVVRFVASETGVFATMQQNDPIFGMEYDPAEVAAVIGMDVGHLLPGFAPQTVSTGNPFCIVALRSVEALGGLAISQREATTWLRGRSTRWFYCIAPVQDGSWRARMQFYGGEDPATGSAAGPCVAWLVKSGLVEPEQTVVIEQGVEMLRPSRITAQASRSETGVHSVRVSGRTIPVAAGSFFWT
jgi:trans-2,3-dihydro-3-hydroxyanthranilate isomerase